MQLRNQPCNCATNHVDTQQVKRLKRWKVYEIAIIHAHESWIFSTKTLASCSRKSATGTCRPYDVWCNLSVSRDTWGPSRTIVTNTDNNIFPIIIEKGGAVRFELRRLSRSSKTVVSSWSDSVKSFHCDQIVKVTDWWQLSKFSCIFIWQVQCLWEQSYFLLQSNWNCAWLWKC